MSTRQLRRRVVLGGLLSLGLAGTAFAAATEVGPSTDTEPYVLPAADGVKISSLLTVDDDGSASNGYELVGIPDGLGATRQGGRNFTLFMNHELRDTQGIARRHGQAGAFVSTFSIDRKTFEIEEGSDTIDPGVRYWNYVTQTYSVDRVARRRQPAQPRRHVRRAVRRLQPLLLVDAERPRPAPQPAQRPRLLGSDLLRQRGVGRRGAGLRRPDRRHDPAASAPRAGIVGEHQARLQPLGHHARDRQRGRPAGISQLRSTRAPSAAGATPLTARGSPMGPDYVLDVVDESVATDAEFRAAVGKGSRPSSISPRWTGTSRAPRQNAEAAQDGLSLNRIEDGAWDPGTG